MRPDSTPGGTSAGLLTWPPHFNTARANKLGFAGDRSVDEIIRWATPVTVFQRTAVNDVEVGHLRSGESTVPFPVGIDGDKCFPYHIGLFATTGMGKSNLMRVLAASVMNTGKYGLLIVDPQDTTRFIEIRGDAELIEAAAGYHALPQPAPEPTAVPEAEAGS